MTPDQTAKIKELQDKLALCQLHSKNLRFAVESLIDGADVSPIVDKYQFKLSKSVNAGRKLLLSTPLDTSQHKGINYMELNDKIKELEGIRTNLKGINRDLLEDLSELSKQNDAMKTAICIYCREMLGYIDWQSGEQAINYMLSFTEENPQGDEALATVKGE